MAGLIFALVVFGGYTILGRWFDKLAREADERRRADILQDLGSFWQPSDEAPPEGDQTNENE